MYHFTRRSARISVAATAAVLALGVVGCSNDDDNSTASATTTAAVGTSAQAAPGSGTEAAQPTEGPGGYNFNTAIGPVRVAGAAYAKYLELGGEAGPLGAPVGHRDNAPNGGMYQEFENGALYWSQDTGLHAVWGDIYDAWYAQSGANGPLGYPVTDETPTPDGGQQVEFAGGVITWNNGQATVTPN